MKIIIDTVSATGYNVYADTVSASLEAGRDRIRYSCCRLKES